MNKCLYCDKELEGKKVYCSEAHRKAYTRRTKVGHQPGQNDPDITTRTLDFKLTRTDSKFEDYKSNYYKFGEIENKRKCQNCNADFKTRLELLKYCSPKCMKLAVQSKAPPSSEWLDSAETKTQAEIESHYTLENFPMSARYYSANGGGTGALSPYKQTDPRYKVYIK